MASLPPVEDPRLWHPAVIFDPETHRTYFSDDSWGGCFASHIYGLPAPVHAHVRVVPEGLLLHSDCDRCSARDEVVLDFRAMDGSDSALDSVAVEMPLFGAERVRWLQMALWETPLREWADRHRACQPVQLRPTLPPTVQEALAQLSEAAAAELAEQGSATPCLAAVAEGRGPVWFDASVGNEAQRMLTGFRVREALAGTSEGVTERAADILAVEEVSLGGGATALRLGVLTGNGNWVAYALIDRFDRPAPGRGILRPLLWARMRGSTTWLDGLRARRRPFPVPRTLEPVDS